MTTIEIMVGGIKFVTLKSTLMKSTYFANACKFHNDQSNTMFIDCDPEHFKHILNYLRFGNYLIPSECEYLLEYFMINNHRCQTVDQTMIALEDLSGNQVTPSLSKSNEIFLIISKIVLIDKLSNILRNRQFIIPTLVLFANTLNEYSGIEVADAFGPFSSTTIWRDCRTKQDFDNNIYLNSSGYRIQCNWKQLSESFTKITKMKFNEHIAQYVTFFIEFFKTHQEWKAIKKFEYII